MKKIDDAERMRLHADLVKLADLLETCDYGDSNHRYYNKEYKKVAKLLYPEMYETTKKLRKPSQKFIRTLLLCECGEKSFTYKNNADGIQISCKSCGRKSEQLKTNNLARDSWNATFNISKP